MKERQIPSRPCPAVLKQHNMQNTQTHQASLNRGDGRSILNVDVIVVVVVVLVDVCVVLVLVISRNVYMYRRGSYTRAHLNEILGGPAPRLFRFVRGVRWVLFVVLSCH